MVDAKDQPGHDREAIKGLISTFRMLADDTRPSGDIASPFGASGLRVFSITPESLGEAQGSPQKAAVMSVLMDAFNMTDLTAQFRTHLLELISSGYNFSLPSEYALAMLGVDLPNDDLGVFEPGKAHESEKAYLGDAIKSACLRMVGAYFISIPEEEEAKLTPEESARLVQQLFADQSGAWVNKETLEAAYSSFFGIDAFLGFKLRELAKIIEWADLFNNTYRGKHDNVYAEAIDTIRPVLQYM